MKVGDLVQYWRPDEIGGDSFGIIVNFDVDGDPIVSFIENAVPDSGYAYFRHDIEVISESR